MLKTSCGIVKSPDGMMKPFGHMTRASSGMSETLCDVQNFLAIFHTYLCYDKKF